MPCAGARLIAAQHTGQTAGRREVQMNQTATAELTIHHLQAGIEADRRIGATTADQGSQQHDPGSQAEAHRRQSAQGQWILNQILVSTIKAAPSPA